MNDLDQLLRDAGARLRDSAPSAAATEAALTTLGDVDLDERPPSHRRRLWVIAPAILAAAAAVVGVLVITRPAEDAVVPADTTLAPAPSTSVATSTTVATSTSTAPTTSTIAGTDLGFGVSLQTSSENFDGDGGACLTLSTATDSATGCADGPTMRRTRPLSLHLDGTPYSLSPTGVDGTGEPTLSDEAVPCLASVSVAGILSDIAGCSDEVIGVVGTLPTAPDGAVAWTLLGSERAQEGVDLDLIDAADAAGVQIFRSRPTAVLPTCLVVVAPNDSVREACGLDGARGALLAGPAEAPVAVDYDLGASTASASAVDATTTFGVSGCVDLTAGTLLGLVTPHGAISALLCGGDAGVAFVPAVLLHDGPPDGSIEVLGRAADGTWSMTDSGTGIACDDGATGAAACTEIGITDLAQVPGLPAVASITAFAEALGDGAPLPGRAAPELDAVQSASDLQALADAIVAEREASGAEPGQVTIAEASGSPIVIRQSNMDDSLTATIFSVFATPADGGGVAVTIARAVDVCGRGTTTLEGSTVCV